MSGIPWETVTLTTLSRDRRIFPELLAEARDMAMRGHEGKLVIHTPWGIEWKPFGLPRRKRPVKSVVLQQGISEMIADDLKAFLNRRRWYADRGTSFPWIAPIATHPEGDRYSLSSRLSSSWASRFWKVLLHSSSGRIAILRHMPAQPVGAWSRRR